jgi:hypothetical protein
VGALSSGLLAAVPPTSAAPREPLALGTTVGSVGSLIMMGGGSLLVILVVLVANLYARWQRSKAAAPRFEENTVEASPGYRRYLAASAWAGGSGRNWDSSVRPVLGELVELTVARRYPAAADVRAKARELLGPELWALVDRDAPRSRGDAPPGAGRPALLKILERMEEPDDELSQ